MPMLPVVKGVPRRRGRSPCTRCCLVAISLVFFAVARMGAIYLVAAVVLGAIFLWRSYLLVAELGSPEGSLKQSIRLYKYSISYLTLLFASSGQPRARADRLSTRAAMRARRTAAGILASVPGRGRPVGARLVVGLGLVRHRATLRRGRRAVGDVVFVGTVLRPRTTAAGPPSGSRSAGRGRIALAETVLVRGGPEPGTATSVDRTYLPRLPVRRHGAGRGPDRRRLQRYPPWTEDLESLRPAGVSPAAVELPTDPLGSVDMGSVAAVAGLLVFLLVAIVAYLYVLRARRRPPDWHR